MSAASTSLPAAKPAAVLGVSALAWGIAAAAFLLLRLGPVWQAPVGGPELDGLAGAWQARTGLHDERFVGTLFQVLTSLLLRVSDSELPPRVLAYLATATIPAALYTLRTRIGEAPAILALLILALEPLGLSLGVSASAMGFDLAFALWLYAALHHRPEWPWLPAAIAFLAVLSGPLVLPLLLAAVVLELSGSRFPTPRVLAPVAAAAAAAVLLASIQFGLGFDGVRVPAFDLFAASASREWSSLTVIQALGLYAGPLVLAGLAAAGWTAYRWWTGERDRLTGLLLAWAAFALAWAIAAAGTASTVPAAALTLPLALLLAPLLESSLSAMLRADWSIARYALPVAGFVAAVGLFFVADWARLGKAGSGNEQFLVGLFVLLILTLLGWLASNRAALPTLVAAALAISVFPLFANTFGVALSGRSELIPSPRSTVQARQLRDIALAARERTGGQIVIHPDLREAATWPFRDSGTVTFANIALPDAAIVLWPTTRPAPQGVAPLAGTWALTTSVTPPPTLLATIYWYIDRNSAAVTSAPIAVYTRGGE